MWECGVTTTERGISLPKAVSCRCQLHGGATYGHASASVSEVRLPTAVAKECRQLMHMHTCMRQSLPLEFRLCMLMCYNDP